MMAFKMIHLPAVKFTLFLSVLKETAHVNQHVNKDVDTYSFPSKTALAIRQLHIYLAEHPCASVSASGNKLV